MINMKKKKLNILQLTLDILRKRISIEEYNKEMDEALKRVRGGKFVENDEVMKEMNKW